MIPLERRITDDTRLIDLTVGELKELFGSLIPKNEIVAPAKTGQNLVYGIKGIMDLFHCSETTAYRLKSGIKGYRLEWFGTGTKNNPIKVRTRKRV